MNGTPKKKIKNLYKCKFIKSILVSKIDLKFRSSIMVVSKRSHIYFRETNKTFGFSIGLLFVFLRINIFNLIFDDLFCPFSPCYAISIAYKEDLLLISLHIPLSL